MSMSDDRQVAREPVLETEVQRRVQAMRDEELIQLVRDAIVHLEVLGDRLEAFSQREGGGDRGAG